MKQNERFLVYAVTGFLALILVVALVFSPEPGKNTLKASSGAKGLDDILNNKVVAADAKKDASAPSSGASGAPENSSGLPAPKPVAAEQPLVAPKPLTSADLVLQAVGPSRVERGVRFVRAMKNDSLEVLVKRWCGARDPYLAEAKALNEDLVVLRAGQEVALPLVADDAVLAAIEAQKPKTLTPEAPAGPATATPVGAMEALLSHNGTTHSGAGGGHPGADGGKGKATDAGGTAGRGVAGNAAVGKPDFVQPGQGAGAPKGGADVGAVPAAATGTSYTVKDKDSLWGISAKTYGKKNADRMIPRIKDANPGLAETLRPGQKLVLPPADAPSKTGA